MTRGDLKWVAAWALLGVGYALTVLGALSIGPLLLPFVALGTWALGRQPASRRRGAPAVAIGVGLVALWVALDNRDGPGEVCHRIHSATECTGEWSPWPWLTIGVALIGIATFALARRYRPLSPPDARDRDAGLGERLA